MKTLILAIALIAFTFVSCSDSQAPTASQNTNSGFSKVVNERDVPLSGCISCDECCVCFEGSFHIVQHSDGKLHINGKLTGVGVDCATGDPIVDGPTYSGMLNANVTPGENGVTGNQTIHLLSNDGGCDIKLHITVNANGEVTVAPDCL
jgi:hypothetical protein